MSELGALSTHHQYVNLYYNGQFRGLYSLRERFDDNHAAAYLGGSPSDYEHWRADGASHDPEPTEEKLLDGSGAAYSTARNSWNPDYWDVDAGVATILAMWNSQIYSEKEWRVVGPSNPAHPGGLVWMPNDLDRQLSLYNGQVFLTPGFHEGFWKQPNHLGIFELWSQVPAFRERARVLTAAALCGNGPMTDAAMLARVDRLAASVEGAVLAEWHHMNNEWLTGPLNNRAQALSDVTSEINSLRSNLPSYMSTFRAALTSKGLFDGCGGAPASTLDSQLLSTVGETINIDAFGDESASYSASGLPAGLSIDASTGTITGAATSPGVFTVS